MARRLLVPILALLVWAAAAPAQAKLRVIGPFPEFSALDGGRYTLGYSSSGSPDGPYAPVGDLTTGKFRVYAAPSGCYAGGIGSGKLLWTCPSNVDTVNGRVLDLRTGLERSLPIVHRSQWPDPDAGDGASYARIGRRWAQAKVLEYQESSDQYYHYLLPFYVDLRTGATTRGAGSDQTLVDDLDRPELTRRLCDGMQRPFVPDEPFHLGLETGDLVIHGPTAAAVTYRDATPGSGRLVLQRCGKPPVTIRECTGIRCASVVLDDRTLAWVEAPASFDARSRSTVRIRSLRTGRMRSFIRRGFWSLALYRHRLYATANGRLLRIVK